MRPEAGADRWLALLPVVLAAIALVVVTAWPAGDAVAGTALMPLFPLLILAGALAGLHAPLGARSLGLGAVALPVVLAGFGASWAGWFGAAAFVLARGAALLVPGLAVRRPGWPTALAADLSRVVLGCLAAGLAWRTFAGAGAVALGVVPGLVYVAVIGLLGVAETALEGRRPGSWPLHLIVDLAGWALGYSILGVVSAQGWGMASALLAATVLLALEAARSARRAGLAERRARELTEVALAGHRIIFRNPDLLAIAEQIQIECRRMFSFFWFEFELLRGQAGPRSWHAGPDGRVRVGPPELPPQPPTLPGVHRRSGWKVIERELATHEEVVARLRFWCDPRQLEAASLDLFDSLLPQMAASIQRALLDREARHDPLTDLPDRRSLESRLERVYEDCLEEGLSMAVILCDLDRFKKINDRYGHKVGDQALIEITRLLEIHRRDSDLCARYGGEEFALVLERTDGQTALAVAERLRSAVELKIFTHERHKIPLRLSAGVAAFPELHVKQAAELLELADEALYEAKRQGRNRCLLNLGQKRYLDRYGDELQQGEKAQPAPEPPSLFS